MKYVKPLAILFVSLTVLFFIGGYFVAELALFEWFDNVKYLKLATVFGGLASIMGLLALILPSITTEDLKRLESDSLKEVARLADEMQKADKQNLSLKNQNKNLELQIKKASLVLSLENKLERNYADLIEIYYDSLKNKKQLEALNQDIAESENADELQKIIELIKRQEREKEIEIDSLFWFKPNMFGIGIDVNAVTRELARRISKK